MQVLSKNSYSEAIGVRTPNAMLLVRVGLVLAGLATAIFATVAVAERTEANSRSMLFVPLAIGVALVISGLTVGTRRQGAGFWFALAMVGQALSIQLVNAGYQLRYQHYKQFTELLQFPSAVFLSGVVLQAIIVTIGMRNLFPTILAWLKTNVRTWQLVLLALAFFLPTTTVSPDVKVYMIELMIAGAVQLVALMTILLFAHAIPDDDVERLRGVIDRFAREDVGKPSYKLLLTAILFVVLLAIGLNILSYQQHPHVPDEIAYLMQARFFSAGVVAMPAPPVPEAFDVYLMKVDGGVWYPVTPPGWALLLAVGTFIGTPLVVNPVLAGLNIFLCYWLVGRLYSYSTANLTLVLLAASPWFIFLAMSFMTHMAALTCLLMAAAAVVKARETENWIWAFVSGLAIGFISMIRPLEAVGVGGLIGLWVIGVGGKRLTVKGIGALAFGTVLMASLGLMFNAKLTGNPLQFPINLYTDELFGPNSNAYGFGPDRGMGWQLDPNPGHGPVDALINSNLNISALNTELLGWTIGSFFLIGAFLCFGKMVRSDLLMIAIIVAIYALHFFYYFSGGPDFGARYWFLMIMPLIVLSVRGIRSLAARLAECRPGADVRLYAAAIALTLLTLSIFIPWRAVDKYHNFRGMMAEIPELAREFQFGRSLVLIQGNKHPDYDSAFIYNSLNLDAGGPIYAWDKDANTRQKLLAVYGDRPIWIVRGPSITGDGYQVAEGPINSTELLASDTQ